MSTSPDHPGVLQHLKGLLWNGREDLLGLHAVAQRAAMDQLMRKNIERQFAMSDAQIQKCNPDYTPTEKDEEMSSPVFINAGIMGDGITNQIASMLQSGQPAGLSQPQPGNAPQHAPAQPGNAPQHAPAQGRSTVGSMLMSGLAKTLPLLAVAGVSIAAAKYFAPEDKNNAYDIQALPYQPSTPQPPTTTPEP